MSRWLLVRSAGRVVALPAEQVDELVPLSPPQAAPGVDAAVRGVAPLHGRFVPLVHLAALLGDGTPPAAVGDTGVAVRVRGRALLLEVDEATDLAVVPETPLPEGWRGRWATGALRQAAGLVPILDLEWLAERLAGPEGSVPS